MFGLKMNWIHLLLILFVTLFVGMGLGYTVSEGFQSGDARRYRCREYIDMSKYMLKTECPALPNMEEYVKKSEVPPCPPCICSCSKPCNVGKCPPCPRVRCPAERTAKCPPCPECPAVRASPCPQPEIVIKEVQTDRGGPWRVRPAISPIDGIFNNGIM
jgi:hypothetical protein